MDAQPNWHDVRFNHRAAQEAIAQCRSVATALRRANQQRNGLAASAREEWRGRSATPLDAFRASRSEFVPPIPELDGTLRQLARSGRAMDEWVGRIGRAFAEADGGRTDRSVSIADVVLLPIVGPLGPLLPQEFTDEILDDIKDIAD